MRISTLGLLFLLAASGANAAPAHQHGPARKPAAAAKCEMCAKCPMCQEKMGAGAGGAGRGMMGGMGGGRMGGGMMGGMGGGMMGAPPAVPTVTVATDGTVVVLRGNTLLKYDSALKLVAQTELPAGGGHDHH